MSLRSPTLLAAILIPWLLLAQPGSSPPPKQEVRAVWLTTAAGLDWPRTSDSREQQASLRKIVRDLKGANFNTIFFQARARGDAYYESRYEPWAKNLTGTMGQDPGWDPLAVVIEEAHACAMELHAWINVYKVRNGNANGTQLSPLHPSRAYPDWVVNYGSEQWLDPGIPEVRTYLVNVVMDLVRGYDVDGINFDFVRYPGSDFADDRSYRRYGGGMDRNAWRVQNINRFVTEAYDRATKLKPMLKVGSSPLGVPGTNADPESRIALRTYSQDAPAWLRMKKQDYVSPQIYWDIGESRGDPGFARLVRKWYGLSSGRHVYAGIAAYKPEVAREITAEIDSARAGAVHGQAFFRYENIQQAGIFGTRYSSPACVPPMPWKDAVAPLPPGHLACSEVTPNVFYLEWKAPPPASDGDRARYYAIYRSSAQEIDTNDPRFLVGMAPGSSNGYFDTLKAPTGVTYHYAVAALDKGNNESAPSNVASAAVREILALKNRLPASTSLNTSISHEKGIPTLVAYHLARRSPVQLSIYRELDNGRDSLYTTLVNRVQNSATYVVGLATMGFAAGRYAIKLKTGETEMEQKFEVKD